MNEKLVSRIHELVGGQIDRISRLRRLLHKCPEPGFEEKQTSGIIAGELDGLGLSVRTGVAKTGIVADMDTGRDGPGVLIRADMDALPIKEHSGVEYSSQNPEFSHSCGHDGHSATVVGVARVLKEMSDAFDGRVRFLFQPAEEICLGARAMIGEGVLDGGVDAILGLHAWPGLAHDQVACRVGTMMASCDVVSIRVIGKGGHGARPHLSNNPLGGMARVVEKLGAMNSDERIVSLCTARVGRQANVIASRGKLTGTVRALTSDTRHRTLREIEDTVQKVCGEQGLRAEVSFEGMSPAVVTDEKLYEVFRRVGGQLLGAEKVLELDRPSMGSEDFGCYLEHVPGLIFRVGMGDDSVQLHDGRFNFNDDALATGMMMLCGMVAEICGKD